MSLRCYLLPDVSLALSYSAAYARAISLASIVALLSVVDLRFGQAADPLPAAYSIPTLDLADQRQRQVVVDREAGQYLGHPTTVLLEDGRTILCVYPKGHGRGAIVYKRSLDGGLTWSDRLPTPASWATGCRRRYLPFIEWSTRRKEETDRLVRTLSGSPGSQRR